MDAGAYAERLAAEAEFWGRDAERRAREVPPDWEHQRQLRDNAFVLGAEIDALLAYVRPGMRTLELGCCDGAVTLAMAERGAHATGLDISPRSLEVARAHYSSVRTRIAGCADYRIADLNHETLPPETYDVVAVRGTLHHLVRVDHAVREICRTLRPGGLLWLADSYGQETFGTVLVTGALAFVLPTATPYRDKVRALLRFGLRVPSRVRASMQTEGLSPFEGAGRGHDFPALIGRSLAIERRASGPAFTRYLAGELRGPEGLARRLLGSLGVVDGLLVRMGVLRSTQVILWARKPGGRGAPEEAA
jgi:2-polyprenyl-3-methyl-5-hydroxy-6-metoxy-1,4-benzoquinol methylase